MLSGQSQLGSGHEGSLVPRTAVAAFSFALSSSMDIAAVQRRLEESPHRFMELPKLRARTGKCWLPVGCSTVPWELRKLLFQQHPISFPCWAVILRLSPPDNLCLRGGRGTGTPCSWPAGWLVRTRAVTRNSPAVGGCSGAVRTPRT